jgi:hypothetical protein
MTVAFMHRDGNSGVGKAGGILEQVANGSGDLVPICVNGDGRNVVDFDAGCGCSSEPLGFVEQDVGEVKYGGGARCALVGSGEEEQIIDQPIETV